jgi:2,5-diketo-D-gluconate reductase B
MVDSLTSGDVPRASGMPTLGLGTWQNDDRDQCVESVKTALSTGYRHVDTAQAYGNEDAVGEAIAESDVPRDEVFLATKVWIDDLGYEDVLETTEESLKRLGVNAVDLLYVHWPSRTYDPAETLPAFDDLRDEGRIDRVGVSNFEPEDLHTAADHLDAPIFANQVECHPKLPQGELREVCREMGIELVAYSPLARGEVFDVPELEAIAEDHDASAAQVSLAWLREHGVTAIPKATGREHIGDNFGSLSLSLSEEEVETIDGIPERERTVDPDFAPW